MSTEVRAQRNGAGYAAGPVTKPPAWHGLVAWDMLFNNLTTGLFLVAALGELAAPPVFTPVAKAAYPLALALLIRLCGRCGQLVLWPDTGEPPIVLDASMDPQELDELHGRASEEEVSWRWFFQQAYGSG